MNLFGISSVILSLSGILFSFIIYRSDSKNKINRYWFISCIVFSLWSFSLYIVTSTSSRVVATLWQYVLDISAIFLPATYFLFLSEFLKYRNRILRASLILIALAFSIFSLSSLFKTGVTTFGEFFWIQPGPYYNIFPLYFIVYAFICLVILVRAYRKSIKGSVERSQIRNIILGGIAGYAGGVTNFFPQVFSVYPFGNYLVIFYIVFMVYGVIKYKLLSAKVISAQLFSAALFLASILNVSRSNTLEDWAINSSIVLFVIVFGLLLMNSVSKEVKQRERIEQLATKLEASNSALEGANKSLEVVNKNLAVANDKLKELDQLKSEFVSLATHQIRGPLTAIKGYVSLMMEGDYGKISDKVKEALDYIYKSTESLVLVVGDFLDVSRIEQGRMKYEFKKLDLRKLVTEIVNELKPNIDKAGLDFSLMTEENEKYVINGDHIKLRQVIANIIDNSVKYTPKGSVKVSLEKAGDKILFSVKDTGVGIKPETLPKLFAKFSRAQDASLTNTSGTGLGLYLAKSIIEAHHGKIWAESEGKGKGSQFYVEMEAKPN